MSAHGRSKALAPEARSAQGSWFARGTIAMLMATAVAVPLSGCGEKPQTSGQASTKKSDSKPWEAVQSSHVADGYKAGDKTAWEAQLKTRTERGQNEYTRTVSAKSAP
jgi:hypothetical protein